ncbi:M56 family metallopeptidase [Pelagicoccus enzymogenes]|uniref:M56 family metallopeptidase n=1 Tax=Pelagicoccus enzymogenes TaxID=2773457 RepID=UPI00280D403D|nr:M56 family metallopeptidase [Pelagicoccus enzymogenes]MDQ8196862.1 M56 family metallopeptidase [Pelagicoccus enzymogenes]
MADLFWSYWDASVRFALLSFFMLLAIPALRRWLSPKLLCWAWALLVIRLSLPIALPFSHSIFNLSENLQPSTWTSVLRSGVVEAGWGETFLPDFRTQDELVKSTLVGFSWENALVSLWAIGILVLIGRLVTNAIRLHRFFNRAERINSGRLYEVFKDTRRRFGIHANVPLLVSRDVKTPGIAGIFNPRVVIPKVLADELSDEEIRCVLLHELTHYKRGDLFLHHLLMLVCFIHWYNPLVWLVFRQFKISMEQACDADVVNTVSITTVRDYGLTLLRVMQRCRGSLVSPAGALCLLGNRKASALRDRIHLIASPRRSAPIFAILGLGLFGASFVYSITEEAEVENEAERLLGLTRFSGSAFFRLAGQEQDRADDIEIGRLLDSALLNKPRSWLQEVDVSSFAGREVVARVTYEVDAGSSGQDFWVSVKNEDGRIINRTSTAIVRDAGSDLRFMELRLGLASSAREIDYGLRASGSSGVWLRSFELLEPSGRERP